MASLLFGAGPLWAIDARTGREIWHYFWRTKGGIHIGNRGVGMYGNWLYFLTPDNYFVSLDAATGKERWHKEIASVKREYFSTNAPIVIGNRILIGVGGDSLDVPGYLEARDPEAGEVVWRWNTTPRPGEPGSETWPDEYSMLHGGGMPWLPGTYDPDLNLYYVGTGNANPVLAGQSRAGDNLWTCSIVALNVDTGKMAWYYQATPHDTHDWDAAQTPVLIDGVIDGQPRKLLAQANRNGYFFLLDRTNGKHILTTQHLDTLNWSTGLNRNGQPIPNPAKERRFRAPGLRPTRTAATNWPPPRFNPETGLLMLGTSQTFSVFYRPIQISRPQGWGAASAVSAISATRSKPLTTKLAKCDGVVRCATTVVPVEPLLWAFEHSGGYCLAMMAEKFVAYDRQQASRCGMRGRGQTQQRPQTFMLDGRQYVVVGAGDSLFVPRAPVTRVLGAW